MATPAPDSAPLDPALDAMARDARVLPLAPARRGAAAIPGILLALALMALVRASLQSVIVALVIPEIPRTVRLVRASVLSLRELVMVEGARAVGAGTPRILLRYILPALVAPLIVQ